MDISYPLNMSVSEDRNRCHDLNQLSLDPPQCTSGVTEDVSLNDDVEGGLSELFHMENVALTSTLVPPSANNDNYIRDVEEEGLIEELPSGEMTISYVYAEGEEIQEEDDEEDDEFDEITAGVLKGSGYNIKKPVLLPIPLPSPENLVSAMKGSREKQGTPLKNLAVTWAPDVYDPLPSSPSPVTSSRKQRNKEKKIEKSDKKSGKNKQKGAGKPTKGKDKKQARKYGGGSEKRFNSFDDDECDDTFSNNFDVGSPDSYCGSSFMKKSVRKSQLSVAEAS